jgi:uncharacterized protein (TIGR02996 family)
MLTAYADAFLDAILECPEDDAPRLIYADWLDEQDEPARAELIRLQCALAAGAFQGPALGRAQARERELLALFGEEWAALLRGLVRAYEFRRGFVERVRLDAAGLLRDGEEVFRLAPVRHLELFVPRSRAEEVADCPLLGRLHALDLSYSAGDRAGLAALLASPHLAELRGLRLRALAGGAAQALFAADNFPRLTTLDLGANNLGLEGLAPLLALRWPELHALHLNANGLKDGEAQALAASPLLGQLTALDLAFNGIGPAGAAALAHSPHAGELRALWLGFNHVGDAGAAALASGRSPLRRLFLGRNRIGRAGAEALARSPRLASLTHLDLDYNDLSAAALQSLAASPHLGRLEALYLRCGRGLTARARAALEQRFGASVCRF